jgi:hypothetical protein
MDKSASLGKGMEKSAKPDKPHHSDKLNRKKKAFEKKANSKTADISFCTDKKPILTSPLPSKVSRTISEKLEKRAIYASTVGSLDIDGRYAED